MDPTWRPLFPEKNTYYSYHFEKLKRFHFFQFGTENEVTRWVPTRGKTTILESPGSKVEKIIAMRSGHLENGEIYMGATFFHCPGLGRQKIANSAGRAGFKQFLRRWGCQLKFGWTGSPHIGAPNV